MSRRVPIRLERRLGASGRVAAAAPLLAGVVALIVTALVLLVAGQDPLDAYGEMVDAAFGSKAAFSETLTAATPLIFTGLAAAVAFRMRIWNIGGEGQLFVGAVSAATAGIYLGDAGLAVALPTMLLAGIAGGSLWAALPGLLRAYLNTSEILTSLMLNYIGALLMSYMIFGSTSFLRDTESRSAQVFPQGKEIPESAFWPGFTDGAGLVLPLGFLIGAALAVALFVVMRYTRFGFQLRVLADSEAAARYAGMRTKRVIVAVMLLSGALAGLAGASQLGDVSHSLAPRELEQATFGYTGIVVAALARYSPLGVVAGAVFLGGLVNSGFALQGPDFPLGLVGTMEGIILFCVLAGEALVRYRVRLGRRVVTTEAVRA